MQQENISYCHNCGKLLEKNAMFCGECGCRIYESEQKKAGITAWRDEAVMGLILAALCILEAACLLPLKF